VIFLASRSERLFSRITYATTQSFAASSKPQDVDFRGEAMLIAFHFPSSSATVGTLRFESVDIEWTNWM
jgi:hypothetical protein